MRALWLPLMGLSGALACAEGERSRGTDALAYSPCEAGERVGRFSIVLGREQTTVEGRVASGVVAADVPAVTDEQSSCRLLEGRRLSCDPTCGAGETCAADGRCVAYPAAMSVGVVAVSGLSSPLEMQASAFGVYANAPTRIPHPGFLEGDEIALAASGGALAGFVLEGRGVASLEGLDEVFRVTPDAPLSVTWRPGSEPSARLRLGLELAHHGGVAASIVCDALADDGHFEVPTRLLSALLDRGVAGFPTLTLARLTIDSARIAEGCVELEVRSERTAAVLVDGVRSCVEDEDCEAGASCGSDLTCRREPPAFSFFVTSYEAIQRLSGSADGFGGDLRFGQSTGLAGADEICATIAEGELPGAGARTWRAFLSAADDGHGKPVHAIDRIGDGPWYDRLGRLIATDRASLIAVRPGADSSIKNDLPNERGEAQKTQPGPGAGGTADNHDVLTGSDARGMLDAGSADDTCRDWTSKAPIGRPRVGHSWPSMSGQGWIAAHRAGGCAALSDLAATGSGAADCAGVGCAGGYGAIYCFALDP